MKLTKETFSTIIEQNLKSANSSNKTPEFRKIPFKYLFSYFNRRHYRVFSLYICCIEIASTLNRRLCILVNIVNVAAVGGFRGSIFLPVENLTTIVKLVPNMVKTGRELKCGNGEKKKNRCAFFHH